MAFNHEYPYTDPNRYNADWILNKMKELQARLDEVLQESIDAATENAEAYVDSKLGAIESQFSEIKTQFGALDQHVDELDTLVNQFTVNIEGQIAALRHYVDDGLEADRLQMQLLISQNNEYLLNQMESYLANIKVINFFTGEKVTIQSMFDYLAQLHLNDSIDYDTMALRAKTYTQLAALNINYTNLALHGNTLYV